MLVLLAAAGHRETRHGRHGTGTVPIGSLYTTIIIHREEIIVKDSKIDSLSQKIRSRFVEDRLEAFKQNFMKYLRSIEAYNYIISSH